MPNPFGGPAWTLPGTSDAVLKLHIRQFINRVNTSPRTMVTWLNAVQAIAESSRLGIPAFFVTNPRNHLGGGVVVGIEEAGGTFSQWPGTLGLAATRDAALVEEFSRIAAAEHVAVGMRGAYHPQMDLATEPRWARISGTFGEDADLTSDMARAMMRGFQGPDARAEERGAHRQALPERRPGHRRHRTRTSSTASTTSIPARTSTTTSSRSRPPSTPARSPSCRTTRSRRTSRANRSACRTARRSSPTCCATASASRAWSTRTRASRRSWCGASRSLTVEQRYKKGIDAGVDIYSNDTTPEYVVDLVRRAS